VSQPESANPHEQTIALKDPALAALLAWLIPGLGHIYQGRTAKGLLFMICLLSTFAYGCYLGGSSQCGWARTVYVAWNTDDRRLPYFCQLGIGLPAMPALVQAQLGRKKEDEPFLWRGFMAPPVSPKSVVNELPAARAATGRFTLDELSYHLAANFELGTLFTMIAGLLNILAIYDAWGGPVFPAESSKDEDEATEGNADAAPSA
jgi:hypothetical protein